MKRVLKYRLPPVGYAGLGMHGDAPRPIAVDWQADQLVMWAEVDDAEPATVHAFEVILTGFSVPRAGVHIGSAQRIDERGQPYVVHVYRVPS